MTRVLIFVSTFSLFFFENAKRQRLSKTRVQRLELYLIDAAALCKFCAVLVGSGIIAVVAP